MTIRYTIYSVLLVFFILVAACQKDPKIEEGVDLSGIAYNPTSYSPELPQHFPPLPPTPNNPMTEEGVLLGRHLFYDPILSRDSTISCASCHKQELAFTDGLAKAVGINGRVGTRSSMSIVNLAWVDSGLFWDGRVLTLEELSLHPIEDPVEMDEKLDNVIRKLRNHDRYPEMFRKAFGISNTNQITKELLANALAQFQRIIISGDSKIDRAFVYETEFLSSDELDGWLMLFVEEDRFFEDAECLHCHNPNRFFSDNSFRHNGIISESEEAFNPGRMMVTGKSVDAGRFRVPTLRNIAVTGPYMHDGRIQTLEEVLDHYFSGGHPHRNRDPLLAFQASTNFTAEHRKAMLETLHALTDSTLLTNPAYSNPFR